MSDNFLDSLNCIVGQSILSHPDNMTDKDSIPLLKMYYKLSPFSQHLAPPTVIDDRLHSIYPFPLLPTLPPAPVPIGPPIIIIPTIIANQITQSNDLNSSLSKRQKNKNNIHHDNLKAPNTNQPTPFNNTLNNEEPLQLFNSQETFG